jgi:hypothetical protein
MKFAMILIFSILVVSGNVAGQSWDELGLAGRDVVDVVSHPDVPDTVTAAVADTIFWSTDGGATFTATYTIPSSGRDFTAIEYAPSDRMVAMAADDGNLFGNNAQVYASINGGRNWTIVPGSTPLAINTISINPVVFDEAVLATQSGLYMMSAGVYSQLDTLNCDVAIFDPTDEMIIYEGLKQGNGIGKSTDQGVTWNYYTSGFPAASYSVFDIEVNPLDNQEVYCAATWLEAANRRWEMYRSTDGGVNWVGMGIQESEIEDIEIDATQGFIFVGHLQGPSIHPLGEGVFQSLQGDLPVNQIYALSIVEGEKVLAATILGVYGLDYYPDLAGGYKSVVESTGDGDGIPDPGETIDLAIALVNSLFDGTDISATISVLDDPTVTVSPGTETADYPDIPANSSGINSDDPYTLIIDVSADVHSVDLQLDITANGGANTFTDTVSLMIGAPTILFVDDDGAAAYDTFYTNTMDSMALAYDVWNTQTNGQITTQLDRPTLYHSVIWMSGDESEDILTAEDITVLTNYMATGGRMILTGQNLVEDLDNNGSPDPFLTDVLHITLDNPAATGRILFGVDGDPLGDQIEQCLIVGVNGANNQTGPDAFALEPDGMAASFLTYVTPPGAIGAVHVTDSTTAGQAIVLGFGFEAVNRTTPTDTATVTRGEFLSIMLDQLEPGVGIGDGGPSGDIGIPKAFALGQNYPNPFNPSTTIEFSVPESRGGFEHVVLKIYNLRGQLVNTLVDDERESGHYTIHWDGRDSNGTKVGSGIYVYKFSAGENTATRKMVLLK